MAKRKFLPLPPVKVKDRPNLDRCRKLYMETLDEDPCEFGYVDLELAKIWVSREHLPTRFYYLTDFYGGYMPLDLERLRMDVATNYAQVRRNAEMMVDIPEAMLDIMLEVKEEHKKLAQRRGL